MRVGPPALSLVAAAATMLVPCVPPATAADPPVGEVVALVIEGVGFGHGRGMSQWGAYGRAVNGGQSWTQILDAYYGGTTLGSASTASRVRVRLVSHDGDATVGVISTTSQARWGATGYAAVQARATATPNRYDIYTSPTAACPGDTTTGWTRVAANVAGPVTLATTVGESTAAAGDVLGLCANDGSVTHYRGSIQLTADSSGNRRVVNDVLAESYLRGVVSREVSTSWGNAGGGAGMNALRAQAVAARSYGLAQNRYASSGGYATTCDSTACQFYGGAARRASPIGPLTSSGTCESGNDTFECANTNRAISDTAGRVRRWPDGRLVSTEFSASNGPRTAGGTFPAIDDPFDDVSFNPNHRWTRVIDGDVVAAAFGLGTLTAATSEADPSTPYDGVWDNRVRLAGTGGSVVISDWNFRTYYGLPSPGFVVRAVTRSLVASTSMRLIGDSVALSISEGSTSELPAMLDGVFTSAGYDAVQNRCTSGCGLSGVGAAASVPVGTDVVVVELGYNAPTSSFGSRIDDMMRALEARQVERVVWINLSERSGRADFVAANQALAAATSRWPDLYIIDWRTASAGNGGNHGRWFSSDGIHLTSTGQAEMARFVRNQLLPLAEFPVGSSLLMWDRQTGAWAIRSMSEWQFRLRTEGHWTVGYNRLVAGDFDRDGSIDEAFIWNVDTGTWVVQGTSGYQPTYRSSGTFTRGYDDVIVGDFNSDGFINDIFLWDRDRGTWVVQSMTANRPTYRSSGTFTPGYDTIAVGDWDDDTRLDDILIWDQDSGSWVVQTFTNYRPAYRRSGRWTVRYDAVIVGDLNGDGRLDDIAIVDFDTGLAVFQTWSAFTPVYRASTTFSSTFDLGVAADLDDNRRMNELFLFDRDAFQWQIYRFSNYRAVLARAGTFEAGYDAFLEGVWG